MATEMKRIMVSITPDLEKGLDAIKRELFYNKPYSEVYRYVFALGLKAASVQGKATKKSGCKRAS